MLKLYLLALYRNIQLVLGAGPMGWRRFFSVVRLAGVYQHLDQTSAVFRRQSKMNCLAQCGKCCENAYVESSVLEMMPLAQILWRRKRPDLWIKKLTRPANKRQACIFYEKIPGMPGKGRCRVYVFRPLTCRLFGFAAKINRAGIKELWTCQILKDKLGAGFIKVSGAINQDMPVPLAGVYRQRVMNIDPSYAQKLKSLPEALREAMAVVGIKR